MNMTLSLLFPSSPCLLSYSTCFSFDTTHSYMFPAPLYEIPPPSTEMIGYVAKDQGLPHFVQEAKGVTQHEVNISLSNHRARERKHPKESRIELNKKNFCAATARFFHVSFTLLY